MRIARSMGCCLGLLAGLMLTACSGEPNTGQATVDGVDSGQQEASLANRPSSADAKAGDPSAQSSPSEAPKPSPTVVVLEAVADPLGAGQVIVDLQAVSDRMQQEIQNELDMTWERFTVPDNVIRRFPSSMTLGNNLVLEGYPLPPGAPAFVSGGPIAPAAVVADKFESIAKRANANITNKHSQQGVGGLASVHFEGFEIGGVVATEGFLIYNGGQVVFSLEFPEDTVALGSPSLNEPTPVQTKEPVLSTSVPEVPVGLAGGFNDLIKPRLEQALGTSLTVDSAVQNIRPGADIGTIELMYVADGSLPGGVDVGSALSEAVEGFGGVVNPTSPFPAVYFNWPDPDVPDWRVTRGQLGLTDRAGTINVFVGIEVYLP